MAANVRIEDEAFGDPRIEALGTIAGYNRYEALGRLAHLWRVCTQREAYILSDVQISGCLGAKGPEALIGAELGERVEGGIRIKGTEGRIEWLQKLRASAKAGGAANKRRIEATRGESHTQSTAKPSGYPNGYPNGSPGEPQLSHMASQSSATTQASAEPTPKPNGSPSTSSLTLPSEERAEPAATPSRAKTKTPRKTPDTPHHRAIEAFTTAWQAKYGAKYHFVGKKDGPAVESMLATLEGVADRFGRIVSLYLADSDPYLSNAKHPIGLLLAGFNKHSAAAANGQHAAPNKPLLNPTTAAPAFQRKAGAP